MDTVCNRSITTKAFLGIPTITSALMLTFLTTSCSHLEVHRPSVPPAGAKVELRLHSLLLGLIPVSKPPPAYTLCSGARVAHIDLRLAPTDVLLSMVTLGVYVPHRMTILCAPVQTSARAPGRE
ncbi:MAG: hypothetical protein AB7G93_17605 [Bdellovibrionales bacterium]